VKLIWKQGGIPELPADAPEKPESTFFLWIGIAGAASGSVFFNTYHDTHSLKNMAVGILAGFLPPFMAATAIHAVKMTEETWVKICVFLLTIGAMVVSAQGAAQVLGPAYHSWSGYLFMFVLDGIDLILLYALMQYYKKINAYRKWVKEWLAAQAAAASAPAPAAPVQVAAPAPAPAPAAPVQVAAPAPAVRPAPAVPALAPVQRPSRPALAAGTGAPAPKRATAAVSADAELRMTIAKEMRDRDRPAIEDTQQKIARLQEFVGEFHTRTGGARMNADEASIALRTHKSKIAALRACISEPGEPPAAGEQERAAAGEQERGEETG
jgi:hypothetical protein